jgi:hypothetical protein
MISYQQVTFFADKNFLMSGLQLNLRSETAIIC